VVLREFEASTCHPQETQMRQVRAFALSVVVALTAVQGVAHAVPDVRIDGLTASHAGDRVVFRQRRSAGETAAESQLHQLCVLSLQSKEVTTYDLPNGAVMIDLGLGFSWCPDDTGVVFAAVTRSITGGLHWAVWRLNPDDGRLTRLASLRGSPILQYPLFSPDGRFIAPYTERRDLAVIDVTASAFRYVTDTADVFRCAYAWGQAGSELLYARGYMADSDGIWRLDVETAATTPVVGGVKATALAVSSSGDLAFLTGGRSGFVYLLPAGATTPTKLASFGIPPLRWSPTGDLLAFGTFGRTTVWDAAAGSLVLEFPEATWLDWVGTDGEIVYVRGEKEVCMFEPKTGRSEVLYAAEAR